MRCILETVALGRPCEINEQCVRFQKQSFCNRGTCHCLGNFTEHDKSCRSLVKIGEKCETSEECHKFTTNVTCLLHKCACEKGFVSSIDGNVRKCFIKICWPLKIFVLFQNCLPNAFLMKDCQEHNQCLHGLGSGSICDKGKCVCGSNYQNISINNTYDICRRKVFYGDVCEEHTDCSLYMGETTMRCSHSQCECLDGYELFDAYKKVCRVIVDSAAHRDMFNFILISTSMIIIAVANVH